MTMLAERKEGRGLALADYEARIHLYKEQIGTGYIGIGRTLNEAKAAGVVPHGQWEAWVTEVTGLTSRQAQRCMQAATEIRDGSAMAQLEMSKALLLLSSGLDEETREDVAGRAAEEGATVRQLREEIRKIRGEKEGAEAEARRIRESKAREDAENAETVRALKLQVVQESGAAAEIRMALKQAESDRESLKQQLEETIKVYQEQMDRAAGDGYRRGLQEKAAGMEKDIRKEFQDRIDFINGQRKEADLRIRALQEELEQARQEGSGRWDEGYNAARGEIEAARKEAEALRRNQGDLLEAAEAAEKRAADAEAELEALRAGGAEGKDPAWKVIKMAVDRFRVDCEMLPILDAPGVLRGEKKIVPCLNWLDSWMAVMRDTLAGVVASEGAVR